MLAYNHGYMILPEDKFKDVVIKAGLVTEAAMPELLAYAMTTGRPLDEVMVDKGVVTDQKLGELVAEFLKVPFISLGRMQIPQQVFAIVPERLARKQKIIAFARDESGVKVAMADPTRVDLVEMLAKKTGTKILPHLATQQDIFNVLRSYEKDLQGAVDDLLKEEAWSARSALEDPPVAKIVDLLIDTAYQERASDIHIEPEETDCLVRFRVDGMLHDVLTVPKYLHDRIITRIKVQSSLRTDEHLSAQDGKMRMQLEEEILDIRVSIVPIASGEKSVLRLLSSRSREYSFSDLGMNDADLKKVQEAYSRSYGMILSTGPTGSGKTTSIYSVLKVLNTREKNITTIEDPVEYRIKGANQIQVNVKTNLTFANGLRSILRQDPNIIFVGEIRDSETAGIAVNAALTGHLVLSTLHTNDAATAIPRLTDMKVEPFLVASTVNIIVAQRLVRQVCSQCKEEMSVEWEEFAKNFPPESLKVVFGTNHKVKMFKGRGCRACRNTGYSGRVGLFEVLAVTKEIRKLVTQKADSDVILKKAIEEGMRTMLQDGLDKINRGVTTIEEVLRVTKAEFMT